MNIKVKSFKFLYSSVQESIFLEFVIILIIFFWIPTIVGRVTPENYKISHDGVYVGKIDYP